MRQRVRIKLGEKVTALTLILLALQIAVVQEPIVGWFVLFFYLWSVGLLWRQLLKVWYRIPRTSVVGKITGPFLAWLTLVTVAALPVVWYQMTPLLLFVSFAAAALIPFFLPYIRIKKRRPVDTQLRLVTQKDPVWKFKPIVLLLFLLSTGALALSLTLAAGAGVQGTPWQSLPIASQYFFFLSFGTLLILALSRCKRSTVLWLVIFHSLVVHLYVPLAHEQPWGGDVWRHLAAQEQLVAGDYIPPVLFGEHASYRQLFGMTVPDALVVPHKYLYGQFWSGATVVGQLTSIDLVAFNKWYLPFVWGVVLPVLLFLLGMMVWRHQHRALLLAALGTMPFIFQSLGSLTLPNGLGFLFFLLGLSLWLSFLRTGIYQQAILPLLIAASLFVGYTLYAFLFTAAIVGSYLYLISQKKKIGKVAVSALALIGSVLLFPALELVSGASRLPGVWNAGEQVKRFLGEQSGWYMARMIWPHDIAQGNIFYNHITEAVFVPTLFTAWRWPTVVVMAVLGIGLVWGVVTLLRRRSRVLRTVGVMTVALWVSYLVGWYVLEGDRLFIRRLDPVLALVTLVSVLSVLDQWAGWLREQRPWKKKQLRAIVLVCVVVVAWSTTTVYGSGPDLRVLSTDEVAAAGVLVKELGGAETPCIIADSWPLLAVEAQSSGTIVGGGFPIDARFSQAERTVLYESFLAAPRAGVLTIATEVTGASSCRVLVPRAAFSPERIAVTNEVFGFEPQVIGDQLLW